ncbi:MAG: hypothetical protein JWN41_785, partial [Thermoleophilia bacterium]|nr:hypothetical protein [Thermoleophilia bacterium]
PFEFQAPTLNAKSRKVIAEALKDYNGHVPAGSLKRDLPPPTLLENWKPMGSTELTFSSAGD